MKKDIIIVFLMGLICVVPFTIILAGDNEQLLVFSDQQKNVYIYQEDVRDNINRGNYLKTGNFEVLLLCEIKDKTFRDQKINELNEKRRITQEYEKQQLKYQNDLANSRGKYVEPPIFELSNFLVTTSAYGKEFCPDYLKYIKTTVFFDMQNKIIVNSKEVYFDENRTAIAFIEGYKKTTELNSDLQMNQLAVNIKDIFEKESVPQRERNIGKILQKNNIINNMQRVGHW